MKINYLDVGRLNQPYFEAFENASEEIIRSGNYVGGEAVKIFEQKFAFFNGNNFCIGVSNGLDALTLILKALNIGPGDEVIVPAQTFIATFLPVTFCGAKLVPVDVEAKYIGLDVSKVQMAITPNTKAVITVHLHGTLGYVEELKEVCDAFKIHLIEDCAQAHGATKSGKNAGKFGIASAFSFYPTKNLGALGDAGCVVTDDEALAVKIKTISNYGSEEKYKHKILGVNARLDPLQAKFLNIKLGDYANTLARRRSIAAYYSECFTDLRIESDGIEVLYPFNESSAYHHFVMRCANREKFREYLSSKGIDTLIHYPVIPPYQDCYKDLGFGSYQHAEKHSAQAVSIPLSEYLNEKEIEYIVSNIKEYRHDKQYL